MVIAPHHDDETFGCGGLIALKRVGGISVKVVFLTNGSNAPLPPGRVVDRASLPALRLEEARVAMAALGVHEDDLHFFECPDSKLKWLPGEEKEITIERLRALITEYNAEQVFVTHRDDGHGDHEAAFELTKEAVRRSGVNVQILQYLIWKPWLHPLFRASFIRALRGAYRLPIEDVLGKKTAAIQAYGSQLATLPCGFEARFRRPYELFIPAVLEKNEN